LITGASVPFVYRMGSAAPVVVPLTSITESTKAAKVPKKGGEQRQKLQDEPFLPNLKVYRYKSGKDVKPPLTTSHRNTIRTSREK